MFSTLPDKSHSIKAASFEQLIESKQFSSLLSDAPLLTSPIEEHAAHLCIQIYSQHYSRWFGITDIAREHHGAPHAYRAAIYTVAITHLFIKYSTENLNLSSEDLKLIQLAALFHDTGRKDDGVDYWDCDSAVLLYCYLIRLGVEKEKAHLLAEAVANKDLNKEGYYSLRVESENFSWEIELQRPKNIYQKIIHDADSLDYMRIDTFKGEYLDFYQDVAKRQPDAFEALAQLINEVRVLLTHQGDHPLAYQPSTKKLYVTNEGFSLTVQSILNNPKDYPLLSKLYTTEYLDKQTLLNKSLIKKRSFNPNKPLTKKNLRAAMQEGKLFARSVSHPSKISLKQRTLNDGTTCLESHAQLEARKTARRKHIDTSTSKWLRRGKNGNPNRSLSMVGYSGMTFANSGYLILGPDFNKWKESFEVDGDTGRNKKNQYKPIFVSKAQKQRRWNELILRAKLGGSSRIYVKFKAHYCEIISDIKKYDATFFSPDPNLDNVIYHRRAYPAHPLAPFLQAIYLQYIHEEYHGRFLPIFEYSALKNSLRLIKRADYTIDKLKKNWIEICLTYIEDQAKDLKTILKLMDLSPEQLKIKALYGDVDTQCFHPADPYFDSVIKEEIDEVIRKKIEEVTTLQRVQEQLRESSSYKYAEHLSQIFIFKPEWFPLLDNKYKDEIYKYPYLFFKILANTTNILNCVDESKLHKAFLKVISLIPSYFDQLSKDATFQLLKFLGPDWIRTAMLESVGITELFIMLEETDKEEVVSQLGIQWFSNLMIDNRYPLSPLRIMDMLPVKYKRIYLTGLDWPIEMKGWLKKNEHKKCLPIYQITSLLPMEDRLEYLYEYGIEVAKHQVSLSFITLFPVTQQVHVIEAFGLDWIKTKLEVNPNLNFLGQLPRPQQLTIVHSLGTAFLSSLFKDKQHLMNVVAPSVKDLVLDLIDPPQMIQLIKTFQDFYDLLEVFTFTKLIKKVGLDFLSNILMDFKEFDSLLFLLNKNDLPDEQSEKEWALYLLLNLPPDCLQRLIQNEMHLFHMLNYLSLTDFIPFLLNTFEITWLQKIFSNIKNFDTLLLAIQPNHAEALLEKMGRDWLHQAIRDPENEAEINNLLKILVKRNKLSILERFAEAGAVLDRNEPDTTPLPIFAASEGRANIIRLLARLGVDLNITSVNGSVSALHAAILCDRPYIIEALREANIDINAPIKCIDSSVSPLYYATYLGSTHCVKALIRLGADIHWQFNNTTLAECAVEKGYLDVLEELTEAGVDLHQHDVNGTSLIMLAAINGHPKIIKFLAKRGLDVNEVRSDNLTPLHAAVKGGHLKTIVLLLRLGADLNTLPTKDLLLIEAAAEGHTHIVDYLIKSGLDVNRYPEDHAPALYYAAHNGHTRTVRKLLQAGAIADISSTNFCTPLFIAATYNYVNVAFALVQGAADPHLISEISVEILTNYAKEKSPEVQGAVQTFIDKKIPQASGSDVIPISAYELASLFKNKKMLQMFQLKKPSAFHGSFFKAQIHTDTMTYALPVEHKKFNK